MEEYREGLCVFVDLKKAYDRVLREELCLYTIIFMYIGFTSTLRVIPVIPFRVKWRIKFAAVTYHNRKRAVKVCRLLGSPYTVYVEKPNNFQRQCTLGMSKNIINHLRNIIWLLTR